MGKNITFVDECDVLTVTVEKLVKISRDALSDDGTRQVKDWLDYSLKNPPATEDQAKADCQRFGLIDGAISITECRDIVKDGKKIDQTICYDLADLAWIVEHGRPRRTTVTYDLSDDLEYAGAGMDDDSRCGDCDDCPFTEECERSSKAIDQRIADLDDTDREDPLEASRDADRKRLYPPED